MATWRPLGGVGFPPCPIGPTQTWDLQCRKGEASCGRDLQTPPRVRQPEVHRTRLSTG